MPHPNCQATFKQYCQHPKCDCDNVHEDPAIEAWRQRRQAWIDKELADNPNHPTNMYLTKAIDQHLQPNTRHQRPTGKAGTD